LVESRFFAGFWTVDYILKLAYLVSNNNDFIQSLKKAKECQLVHNKY
jgi:hypothetical protein